MNEPSSEQPSVSATVPSILIVDDEEDVRSSLRRVLKLDRYLVEEAGSLSEIMSREDLPSFFAVILDRKLPDGNADEVLEDLKNKAPETDILIVTGFTDLHGTLAALRHGAEDYLIKPVNPDDLRASLTRLLRLREMRRALLESEARQSGILGAAPLGIFTLDGNGLIESANPAVEGLFGASVERMTGKLMRDLLVEPQKEVWDKRFREVFAGRFKGAVGEEYMARKACGKRFPVSVTLSRVELPNKAPVVTAHVEDITERKQLESDVLEASEDERQRIAQDLHDGLASHLTGVSLLCRMLAEQVEGTPSQTAHQIGDLIDEGIQQARAVARGLYPVDDDSEGLMNSLSQFAARLRRDLKVDCRFECRIPVLLEDNVMANHLYRIAQEAVNNALKHGEADKIVIELMSEQDQICLRIVDDGKGIDEKAMVPPKKGVGLRSMAYRTRLIQGTFQLAPADGGGVEVSCVVPRTQEVGES